jgi:hypothetical protein
LAARLGVKLQIAGAGYVVAQHPSAGRQVTKEGITVRMASTW